MTAVGCSSESVRLVQQPNPLSYSVLQLEGAPSNDAQAIALYRLQRSSAAGRDLLHPSPCLTRSLSYSQTGGGTYVCSACCVSERVYIEHDVTMMSIFVGALSYADRVVAGSETSNNTDRRRAVPPAGVLRLASVHVEPLQSTRGKSDTVRLESGAPSASPAHPHVPMPKPKCRYGFYCFNADCGFDHAPAHLKPDADGRRVARTPRKLKQCSKGKMCQYNNFTPSRCNYLHGNELPLCRWCDKQHAGDRDQYCPYEPLT